ncbi:MAG TPA: hypothetical protein VF960_15375 [Chloroflexota bacterium]
MPRPRQKKRRDRKRVIETALPKRQYKRTNRLLYVFSGILLVVFGGGAALLGTGTPRVPTSTPVPAAPVVSSQSSTPVAQQTPAGVTPTAVAGTPVPTTTPQATPTATP